MIKEKKQREREMSQGLLRQRRNLLLVSIMVPLFFLTGAEIDKINLLGTIIKIENQAVIKWFVALVFGYCCLRYWQYYKEEESVREIPRKIKIYKYDLEINYIKNVARKKINEELSPKFSGLILATSKYSSFFSDAHTSLTKEDKYISPFKMQSYFYAYLIDENSDDKTIVEIPESYKEVEWENSFKNMYESSIDYNPFRFYLFRIIGLYRYLVYESYFTDYQLPIFIAFVSFLSLIVSQIL